MNQRLFALETSTMTKAELSAALCQQLGLNKREAREFVDAFFEELFQKLAQDGSFKIADFGSFTARTKVARPGCNPRTGAPMTVTARRVLTFKPSAALRDRVNSGPGDAGHEQP